MKSKLILFGASTLGEEAYDFLKWDYEILFFCDNSTEKHRKNFCGCKVIMPYELNEINMEGVDIVITSMYSNEILEQLLDMGYDNIKIYNSIYNSIYDNRKVNIDGLFCNTLYYDKKNIQKYKVINEENNNTIDRVLFIQEKNFINSFGLSSTLKKNNIKCDVLLYEANMNDCNIINNELGKYFENVFNSNDIILGKIKFNSYDLVVVCCNKNKIIKLLDEINKPIIEYVKNKKYLSDGIFFHSYVHDILNELSPSTSISRIRDYREKKFMKIRDTVNSIILPIKYNSLSEYIGMQQENTKYSSDTGEIHCVLIDNDEIIEQDYAIDRINQIIEENIHIHVYSYNRIKKLNNTDINRKYIHIHKMINGKDLISELRKYDYAISQYALKKEKFFIADIIDNNLSLYLTANLQTIIDKSFTSEGKIQKYNDYNGTVYIDFEKEISNQLKNKFKNLNKINKEYLFLDFYIYEILNFFLKVKKHYYEANDVKYEKDLFQNKIALRIFTKNRSANVKRAITFYLTMKNIKPKLYIIDGSERLEKLELEKHLKQLNSKRIKHITFEKDPGLYKRIYWTQGIEENIFFNVADDDFFTEKSMESAMGFLEKNNDFGAIAGVESYYSKNYFNDMEIIKNAVKLLEDDDRVLRASEFYIEINNKKFAADNIYSCFRKEVFEKIYSILNKKEFFSLKPFWQEYFGYLITCYVTKIKYINSIVNIREKNECQSKDYGLMIKENKDNILINNIISLDLFKDDFYNMQLILEKEGIHIDLDRAMKEFLKTVFCFLGIA